MDLEGNLKAFSPTAIFQFLKLAESSGELMLRTQSNSARVYFQDGRVIFAAMTERGCKLGEQLVMDGLVSRAELERTLKRKRPGEKLGEALIRAGLIPETALGRHVREQMQRAIYQILRWSEGSFVFLRNRAPKAEDILIDSSPEFLVIDAMRRFEEARKAG